MVARARFAEDDGELDGAVVRPHVRRRRRVSDRARSSSSRAVEHGTRHASPPDLGRRRPSRDDSARLTAELAKELDSPLLPAAGGGAVIFGGVSTT